MKPFPEKYQPDRIEAALRSKWAASSAFKWKPEAPASTDYVIDTPPPTVSGTLHVGHVYSYTQADIIARYFRMSGHNVLYPIGWDDNGLPTERLVEKIKKVRGGDMQRDAFVALCREVIPEYEDQFRELFSRLALSVDWREYHTISNESRTVSQLSFLDLYRKGLVERRLEPTLWDPADRTAIAQAEVDEIERQGMLNYIPFAVEGGGEAMVATTRPELLGACAALIIHPQHSRASELLGRRAITRFTRCRCQSWPTTRPILKRELASSCAARSAMSPTSSCGAPTSCLCASSSPRTAGSRATCRSARMRGQPWSRTPPRPHSRRLRAYAFSQTALRKRGPFGAA
jgi:valyl-tRNA synthetase